MTTPVETIADALIAFILSLLRDPDAVADFAADPDAALAGNNLRSACMADVAAVRPVIVDRPDIVARTQPDPTPPPPPDAPTEVTNEILRIVQQFTTTIDARSTMVDNSVNQNIWAGGDVTQIFDQEAIIASGDGSVAAGDDGSLDNSDLDVTVGDVAIGNDTYDGSFNGSDVEATAPDAAEPDVAAPDATTPDAAAPVPAPPVAVAEPADVLDSDMAATDDSYDSDAASAAVADQPVVDEPVEEE
ncbi:IniB N-terminal domain-containing protein [Microbacterium sp. TWP3-1-2b2]|uniref:IniB N-terminal domain-containing protein n=1 Tax=Microbacterium sp. TWP3-1-2b2 TaxID=2804651 RepID=UPI003CF4212F